MEGDEVECSSIDVPRDHFAKHDSNQTFSVPLVRLRGKQATKNIIINPGGPGGSGVGWLYGNGKRIQRLVGDDFHVLSFDPRGVNGSQPQAICYPDAETRQARATVQSLDAKRDSAGLYALASNLVRACADTMGEHGKYINTPQTAADMNDILDAVGQENMIYWGLSYGSLLGQTYATMFPERSERIIIDGVVNQFDWYEALVEFDDFRDTDAVLDAFFDECIKAGDACALSGFGDSKDDLKRNVTGFLTSLKENPMPVYIDNKTYGVLDYITLWLGAVFPILYKPILWHPVAGILAELMKGNGTTALLAFGMDGGGPGDASLMLEHEMVIHLNDGASGKALWPHAKNEVLNLLRPLFNHSAFAFATFEEYSVKAQWAIPKTHTFKPRKGVKTSHPLLIFSTKYDPVCPLASAQLARESFVDSRLVTGNGYGHCTTSSVSSCVTKHLRAFLSNGTLPNEDTMCDVDVPFFTDPEKLEQAHAQSEHDQDQVVAPQLALAGVANWGRANKLWIGA